MGPVANPASRRISRPPGWAAAALAAAALLSPARPGPGQAAPRPFTEITEESGIGGIVSRHHEALGRWWLSGLTLMDVDGDGALDLHLGSHSGPSVPAAMGRNDGRGRFTCVDPRLSLPRGVRERGDLPYPGGEIRLLWDVDEDGRIHGRGGGVTGAGAYHFRRPDPG